ncbi:MAG: hypothetical protein GIS02_04520 [Methanosarcinales archaeon]|uniref:Uncharacterized protein n=1 Tax=Candidatus Ethanoperedens thermophilum TaxID=2766897 RepID=A0A848DAA8_9EURY|nr:hypothetical protein [Candidatus Ethanoperedens thermophilum]
MDTTIEKSTPSLIDLCTLPPSHIPMRHRIAPNARQAQRPRHQNPQAICIQQHAHRIFIPRAFSNLSSHEPPHYKLL